MVVDPVLPDRSGIDLVAEMKSDPRLCHVPVVVYGADAVSGKDETKLAWLADTTSVKHVQTPEELFDATALFLHRVAAALPESKRRLLEMRHMSDATLTGRKVLIVDDDIRNIFAMTSVLERHGMVVVSAENGKDAINVLRLTRGIDVVLMDIMLPEMDGYETTRAIRKLPQFEDLPVIALTAKAMKGDREKCIAAGASDYIAKPVDTERLLSILRLWLGPVRTEATRSDGRA
jgi:CheY-like chemotaxis protein